MKDELRQFDSLRMEAEDVNGSPVLRGYAVKYGERSAPIELEGGRTFVEEFRAGAFAEDLASGRDVVALFNHDSSMILGRMSAGTLKLEDRSDGLYYEISPPDTSYARDLIASVKRGDIQGASFRFRKGLDELRREGGVIVRSVITAALREVSPVTWPAYPSSTTEARALPDDLVSGVQSIDLAPKRTRAARLLRMMQVS